MSYYDTAPLQATLARLVDFELINSKPPRFSLATTNIRTGSQVYFDNLQQPITRAHIMASASLPPEFPATEIDGEHYWDGAVVSNSPMQYVIDGGRTATQELVFQVDLPMRRTPRRTDAGTLFFTDMESARVQLICMLHYELEIDVDTLPVVLSLIDQLYDTRQRLLSLTAAVMVQDKNVQAAIIAAMKSDGESSGADKS